MRWHSVVVLETSGLLSHELGARLPAVVSLQAGMRVARLLVSVADGTARTVGVASLTVGGVELVPTPGVAVSGAGKGGFIFVVGGVDARCSTLVRVDLMRIRAVDEASLVHVTMHGTREAPR